MSLFQPTQQKIFGRISVPKQILSSIYCHIRTNKYYKSTKRVLRSVELLTFWTDSYVCYTANPVNCWLLSLCVGFDRINYITAHLITYPVLQCCLPVFYQCLWPHPHITIETAVKEISNRENFQFSDRENWKVCAFDNNRTTVIRFNCWFEICNWIESSASRF